MSSTICLRIKRGIKSDDIVLWCAANLKPARIQNNLKQQSEIDFKFC